MKDQKAKMQKRTGWVLLAAIIVFLVYFLFFTPVSPLGQNLRAGVSPTPLPAVGLWGKIGFYERAADNNITYCLMTMFFGTAIYKSLRMIFPSAQKKSGGRLGKMLNQKGCL